MAKKKLKQNVLKIIFLKNYSKNTYTYNVLKVLYIKNNILMLIFVKINIRINIIRIYFLLSKNTLLIF